MTKLSSEKYFYQLGNLQNLHNCNVTNTYFQSHGRFDCYVPSLISTHQLGQIYKFNEFTNYPVLTAQLYFSLIVTTLIGVDFSQVCPQQDEHIAVQKRPAVRELHFSLQATLHDYNHN